MPSASSNETKLRQKLGIPEHARRVLLLQESSHWDTNWLRTSEEYFQERIEPIFEAVFHELGQEPSRTFAVESVFFLKRYWERHPERRDALRALLDSGRLRLLGASLTTPDTLLPHPESVLRDYLLGQEWLRSIGCDVFPRVAYFPDNFGHSPALPSLMRAAGVDAVGVTRIDGMHFVGSDWRLPGTFPLPGSTAFLLQRELKTLDFVWRDASGAEVLCHWNAFTYFQGDMLGHVGVIRWNGTLFGFPWRTAGHVGRQLERFARELEPVSRTPYLFCPIGCDFNPPIPGLVSLIDRYNRERSGKSGLWVVLAGLDDYFDLLASHREALPVLEVDPNPAWMGFYASRPELKTRHTRTARRLLHAEGEAARCDVARQELDTAWELVALSNHHDFITGTSPDRVVEAEQIPWLHSAEALLGPALPALTGTASRPRWTQRGGEVHVEGKHFAFTVSEEQGGCLTRLANARGEELLSGLGLDLIAYHDTGGLWRLGHEFAGGAFRPIQRAADRHGRVKVFEEDDALRIELSVWLDAGMFRRTLWCRDDEPSLRLRFEGLPQARTTVTCRLETRQVLETLRMDAAGGMVSRPLQKLYAPTFWPALSQVETAMLSLSLDAPAAVSGATDGALEWIVARHATKERAFRVLPVLAHPIGGSVNAPQTHEVTLHLGSLPRTSHGWIRCSDAHVRVAAVKPAANRHGIIVRLHADHAPTDLVQLTVEGHALSGAHLCDARERDLTALRVERGVAHIPLRDRIATVRLLRRKAA
jgi:hypothetical protein